jgi:hypothetical protein
MFLLHIFCAAFLALFFTISRCCSIKVPSRPTRQGLSWLADLLKACVNFTGDVDSVATIALASASMAQSIKKDIPERLWNTVENQKFGLNYLIQLESKVMAVTNKVKKVKS